MTTRHGAATRMPWRAVTLGSPQPETEPAMDRTLALLDIENLLGGRVTPQRVRHLDRAYQQAHPIGPNDLCTVATAPAHLADTYPLPSLWRRLIGPPGPDSADLALLTDGVPWKHLHTFTRIVIASGDLAFLPVAHAARRAGVPTTVITTDLSYLHWRLYQACDQHRQLRLAALLDTAA